MRRFALTCLALAALGASPLDKDLPQVLREVGFDQRLGAQVPMDAVFRDEDGRPVRLGDCCAGRPAVLVMAWYRCPMLCTQVLNDLTKAMWGCGLELGKDFNVLTVSFDPEETPELARAKKASYVEKYGRPGAERGWRFLTGDKGPITRLEAAVGFRQRWDPASKTYAHASGIMLLTPEGKVSRYFYGLDYRPRDLRLGLVEASAGKVGSPVDRVLLFCFHFDERAGRYTATVMNFVCLAGALTVLALGALLVRGWLRRGAPAARARRGCQPPAHRADRGLTPPARLDAPGSP
jgi:protein SCO1/2